jgi:LPXTG-motif cell wall-anchored protein
MPEQPLKLRDIRPIVDVPDHSLWLFTALIAGALLLLAALVFWFLRRRKKQVDPKRQEALKRLNALDFTDTKSAVYDFSLLGHYVATPETESTFRELLAELEIYKFKKEVPPLDAALKAKMQEFITEAHRG